MFSFPAEQMGGVIVSSLSPLYAPSQVRGVLTGFSLIGGQRFCYLLWSRSCISWVEGGLVGYKVTESIQTSRICVLQHTARQLCSVLARCYVLQHCSWHYWRSLVGEQRNHTRCVKPHYGDKTYLLKPYVLKPYAIGAVCTAQGMILQPTLARLASV